MEKRSWRVHLGVIVALVFAGVAGFAIAVFAMTNLYPMCEANYSEDTVTAIKSYQGQALCAISEDGDITDRNVVPAVLVFSPALMALVGLAVWIRKRTVRRTAPFALASLLLPALIWGAVTAMPANCTDDQWAKHGARGCERNEELRPGIDRY